MALSTEDKTNSEKIESLKIVKRIRVKEVDADTAKPFKPGQTVKVRGIDKLELLARGLAVRQTESAAPSTKSAK
jgi:hypothetical protein